jgi:hypothetical protein
MPARDTHNSSVATARASAETGGITFNTGAMPPPGNAITWSRASARAALGNGSITASQFVAVMGAMKAQNSLAKATLRNGGDSFPV